MKRLSKLKKLLKNKYQNPLNKAQWVWFLCAQGVLFLLLPDRIPMAWRFGFDSLAMPMLLCLLGTWFGARCGMTWYLPLITALFFGLTASGMDWLNLAGYSLLYLVFSFLGITIGFVIYRVRMATKAE